LGSNQGRRGGKPATSRLSYGTALERGFGDRVVAAENIPPEKIGFSYILLEEWEYIRALVNVVMNFLISLKGG
jgi:hypothetical protein